MADVLVKQFTYQTRTTIDSDRITRLLIKVSGDGNFIREVSEITVTQSDEAALSRTKNSIEKYGITAVDGTHYKLDNTPAPTPPPPAPTSTGGNSAVLNDAAGTVLTGTSKENPATEWSDRTSYSRTVEVTATKNGRNYSVGFYNFYSKDTEEIQKEIWGRTYEDIASRIFNDDVDLDPTIEDKFNYGYEVKVTSFEYTVVPPDQPKEKLAPPPPPPPPPPPVIKDRKRKRERYVPESRYGEPKSTSGGDFVIKETGEDYKGSYIEIFDGRFLSGTKPEENGAELVKLSPNYLEDLMPAATVAAGLLAGFFKAKLKKGDKEKGKTKRYFVQDKRTNKIVETDLQNYQLSQNIPSKRFVAVDWIVKGPAEDQLIKGYPFEGAASKNKKTITAAEKQIPGISAFVTDYSFLVEEPVYGIASQLSSSTVTIQDPVVELENSRKANFDLRK